MLLNTPVAKDNETLERMCSIYSTKYGLASRFRPPTRMTGLDVHISNRKYEVGNVIPIYSSSVRNATSEGYGVGIGGAVSLDSLQSQIKAFGEYIERLCGERTKENVTHDAMFESYRGMVESGKDCLNPKHIMHLEDHIYDNPSIPIYRYDENEPLTWVEGINLGPPE